MLREVGAPAVDDAAARRAPRAPRRARRRTAMSTPKVRNPARASSSAWRPRPIATSSARRGRGARRARARAIHSTTNGEGDIIRSRPRGSSAPHRRRHRSRRPRRDRRPRPARRPTSSRHISFGIFSTMVTLLAHSMMMFYLIGKGKAVKDAMAEHSVTGDYYRRIAAARKPVFSIGTLAMAVTMVAAIMGASVDTGVLPPIVHAMIAYGAIALQSRGGQDRDRRARSNRAGSSTRSIACSAREPAGPRARPASPRTIAACGRCGSSS